MKLAVMGFVIGVAEIILWVAMLAIIYAGYRYGASVGMPIIGSILGFLIGSMVLGVWFLLVSINKYLENIYLLMLSDKSKKLQ